MKKSALLFFSLIFLASLGTLSNAHVVHAQADCNVGTCNASYDCNFGQSCSIENGTATDGNCIGRCAADSAAGCSYPSCSLDADCAGGGIGGAQVCSGASSGSACSGSCTSVTSTGGGSGGSTGGGTGTGSGSGTGSSGATGINPAGLQAYANGIIFVVNSILVPVLTAIAFISFLWGVFKYFILGADNEEERRVGRQFVLWGVIGFAVIFSVWGLVNLLLGTFGLSGGGHHPSYPIL